MSRAAPRALLGTLAGNAIGFMLPFAVISHYGFGRTSDAYFFALGLAIFGIVLSATVIEANALPLMAAAKQHGAQALRQTSRRAIRHSVAGALCVYAPVAITGAIVITHNDAWSHELRRAAVGVTLTLTLLVGIVAATSVLAASSYALGDFLLPTASQALRSIAPMAGLMFIGHGADTLGMLAWLMVAGELIRGALLLGSVRRRTVVLPLQTHTPVAAGPSVWRSGAPHAVAMLSVNMMPVVDKVIASRMLAGGAVTLLDLGEKILYVPLLGITYSVILVAGARWADLGETSSELIRADFTRLLSRVVRVAALMAVVCSATALAVHVIWPGRLAGVPTGPLAAVVVCLMLGLPAGAATNVGSRLFTAVGRTRALPAIALLLLGLDVAFDLLGAKLWGTDGIALATSAVRLLSVPVYMLASLSVLRSLSPGGVNSPKPAGSMPTRPQLPQTQVTVPERI